MQEQRITILDVARDAQVSPATVSRVLNGNTRVDIDLKDRVLQSVHKLTYIPNANAQSLITHNTYEIGFLVSDISNFYYGTIARAVENIVNPQKYNLILCSTDEQKNREYDYLKTMMRRNVDALILNTTCLNNKLVVDMSKSIPIVLMNRVIDAPDFHGDIVDTDGYNGCKLLTYELLRAGHRKIYCIYGPDIYLNSKDRFRGFADAMAEHGITVSSDYPYLFNGQYTEYGGKCAVENLFTYSDPPTAILSLNNMSTLGVMQQLSHYHINIPEDISLAGHDYLYNMNLFKVQPVSALYDLDAISRCAGNAVLERIHNPDLPIRRYIFSPQISEGNSIAPPSPLLAQKLNAAIKLQKNHI